MVDIFIHMGEDGSGHPFRSSSLTLWDATIIDLLSTTYKTHKDLGSGSRVVSDPACLTASSFSPAHRNSQ
jgi:hypothetical protein